MINNIVIVSDVWQNDNIYCFNRRTNKKRNICEDDAYYSCVLVNQPKSLILFIFPMISLPKLLIGNIYLYNKILPFVV